MVSEDVNKLTGICRFGEEFPNQGWVECKSITFPGKVYYFNANSGCSTWTRPIPENIPLPRHSPQKSKNETSNSPTHSEMGVSEDGKKILDEEFAFRISLFYNVPLDEVQNQLSDIDSDYTDRMSISDQSDNSHKSSIIVTEDLEPQILYFYPDHNSNQFRQLEKLLKETDNSCDEDLYYSVRPHLKSLDLFDLDLTGKQQKPRCRAVIRKHKKSSSSSSPSIEGGRVYHMYGTKTINYDLDEYKKLKKIEDLPEEARTVPRRLSDSSCSSSSGSTCSRGSKCSRLSCKSNESKASNFKLNESAVIKIKSVCLSESDSS